LKNIKLNKDQQKIFDFINDLPMNKSAVVLLTGTAGSGKTTLIGKLNEKKGKYDEVIVSSLTGKAAQVLRSKDIKDAKTIASFLNGRPKINLKLLDEKFLKKLQKTLLGSSNTSTVIESFVKWNRMKADLQDSKDRLFIFDEASMIIDVPSGSRIYRETTSTESQLDKIMRKIRNSNGKWHIVMVGDRNQLEPPVSNREEKHPYSDALNKDFWRDKVDNVYHFNLDKIERTDSKSNIYKFTKALRSGDSYKEFIDQKTVKKSVDVNVDIDNLTELLKNDINSGFFICSNNYYSYKMNTSIRKSLFEKKGLDKEAYGFQDEKILSDEYAKAPNIFKGELLSVHRNNYEASVDLFNGDKVVVVDEPDWSQVEVFTQEVTRLTDADAMEDSDLERLFKRIEESKLNRDEVKGMRQEEKRELAVYYKDSFTLDDWVHTAETFKRKLLFLDLKVRLLTGETKRSFKVKACLNSIFLNKVGNRKAADLEEEILELCILQYTVERYRALYKDSKLTQIELEKKIQEKMESDPYLNSLWLSWGYAGTCHKAQGSEWPHVVFDLGNSEWAGSAFAYTGLTRAQETLTILNLDNYRGSLQGEDLNLIGLDDIDNIKTEKPLHQQKPPPPQPRDKTIKDDDNEKNDETPMDKLKKWMKKNDQ
jgi:hypothetical protein